MGKKLKKGVIWCILKRSSESLYRTNNLPPPFHHQKILNRISTIWKNGPREGKKNPEFQLKPEKSHACIYSISPTTLYCVTCLYHYIVGYASQYMRTLKQIYMCVCICVYVYIYVYICVCVCIYIYMYIYICMCIYICIISI